MKKKLIIALFIVTIFSIGIGTYINHGISQVVFKLESIIKVHKVQVLREELIYQLRMVQTTLITKDTQFATDVNTLTNDVAEMSQMMSSCFECHHTESIATKLVAIKTDMEKFKLGLSRTFTIRANASRYRVESETAFMKGQELVQHLSDLIDFADNMLKKRTEIAKSEIANKQRVLTLLIFGIPFAVLLVGIYLLRSFTGPFYQLLEATRKLSAGNLDYRVKGLRHEFGELAESFNVMAESISQQIKNMQRAEQLAVIGQMAAGLAHEIKNPLAGIKVSMEVLAKELDIDDEDKRILSLVILEIDHINSLINELLNYARPAQPDFASLPINQVLEKAIEGALLSIGAANEATDEKESNIYFTTDFAANLPLISADPSQLHQVFLNIFLNGIESMPGGGSIHVKTFRVDSTDSLCVKITDSGRGLPEDIREKIFEPFFTTKKRGTGLGLAICKRLIEQHDGEIIADKNRPGEGTSFSIFLPYEKTEKGRLNS